MIPDLSLVLFFLGAKGFHLSKSLALTQLAVTARLRTGKRADGSVHTPHHERQAVGCD
jgi:hypothetical protein